MPPRLILEPYEERFILFTQRGCPMCSEAELVCRSFLTRHVCLQLAPSGRRDVLRFVGPRGFISVMRRSLPAVPALIDQQAARLWIGIDQIARRLVPDDA